MPKEDTQFKGAGVGIPHGIKPISTKYTKEVDCILRAMPDRSTYIRNAVEHQLRKDGLIE